jgi:hypothetical protein
MGKPVVFSYHMVSPKAPTTLLTHSNYPVSHHSHSWTKMAENSWNMFLIILTSETSCSTHKYVLWANKWCSICIWYHPRCLLHSQPHIVTLWATIATHFWAKMVENGWKHVFNTCPQNLFSHTLICFMGQQMAVNYPMVSPKVPTTFMTPYDYPIGHHSYSFVRKKGQKWFENMFLTMLTSITSYSNMFYECSMNILQIFYKYSTNILWIFYEYSNILQIF